jgi:hypothetical protein
MGGNKGSKTADAAAEEERKGKEEEADDKQY